MTDTTPADLCPDLTIPAPIASGEASLAKVAELACAMAQRVIRERDAVIAERDALAANALTWVRTLPCETCHGSGTDEEAVCCPVCHGEGELDATTARLAEIRARADAATDGPRGER